jgi:arylsulfatase
MLEKWDSCVIWNQWRLIKGTELYDFHADAGEKNDLATQHPDIVKRMRAHYEKWWAGIEPTLRDFQPLIIGSDQENPVLLCCADWQEVYCDNPAAVLSGQGGERGGPWNVEVDKEGTYQVALSRWRPSLNQPLSAAMPERKLTFGSLPEGKSFPIAKARLQVGAQDLTQPAPATAKEAVFRVNLKKGRTQLHGWFQDAASKDLCGAYYALVTRV